MNSDLAGGETLPSAVPKILSQHGGNNKSGSRNFEKGIRAYLEDDWECSFFVCLFVLFVCLVFFQLDQVSYVSN